MNLATALLTHPEIAAIDRRCRAKARLLNGGRRCLYCDGRLPAEKAGRSGPKRKFCDVRCGRRFRSMSPLRRLARKCA